MLMKYKSVAGEPEKAFKLLCGALMKGLGYDINM